MLCIKLVYASIWWRSYLNDDCELISESALFHVDSIVKKTKGNARIPLVYKNMIMHL